MVTPFNRDGSLDLMALDDLVDQQLAAGINGLVPCGTTGEAATLSPDERYEVIARVVKRVNRRVPVIAGTGSNCTRSTIEGQRRAQAAGADCGLVVTPYYNKPTPEGLYRHYCAVAEAVNLPILVYNVPGRTACDLKPEVMQRLRDVPSILGIKEATGDLDRIVPLRQVRPSWSILSGDDATTCPFVLLGGDGVISVVANVLPKETVTMVAAARSGDALQARHWASMLRPLIGALFLEANPIPVKAALALQQRLQESYRLPLCPMQTETRSRLREILRSGGWLPSA